MNTKDDLAKFYGLPLPKIPIAHEIYHKSMWEDISWSAEIKIPVTLIPGMSYRVREDYYKVGELYTDPEVIAPNMRLIGTDVFIFKVEGEFGYIKEFKTGLIHKVYYKFFRKRIVGDLFSPNIYVYREATNKIGPRRVTTAGKVVKTPRFRITFEKNMWSAVIDVSTMITATQIRTATIKRSDSNLMSLLWNCLLWVQEDYGYWNDSEIELYNSLVRDDVFSNMYIQDVLNRAQDF